LVTSRRQRRGSGDKFWVVADVKIRMPLLIAGDETVNTVEQYQEIAEHLYHEELNWAYAYRTFARFLTFCQKHGYNTQTKAANWHRAEYGNFEIEVLEAEGCEGDIVERELFERWIYHNR
jgi:hypothetical protein